MDGIIEDELVVAENKSEDLDENILHVSMDQAELDAEADMDDSSENIADHDTNQGDYVMSSESSSEDENDDKLLKDDEMYVNVVGKRVLEEDLVHAQEMKQSMKEFFMKCSPDVSFSTLVQFFIRRLPQPKPVYVLSSDVCPKTLDPDRKYAIVCAVADCDNAYVRDGNDWENIEQTHNFFGFPTNVEQCKMWIDSIGRFKYLKRNSIEIQNYRVCEIHFTAADFTSEYKDELMEMAVPSLFLCMDQDLLAEEVPVENQIEENQLDINNQ